MSEILKALGAVVGTIGTIVFGVVFIIFEFDLAFIGVILCPLIAAILIEIGGIVGETEYLDSKIYINFQFK